MMLKTNEQRFVFADMSYQDFPNSTGKECVLVERAVDLVGKKILNGELVNKTGADLAAEKQLESDALDAQYKAQRSTALSSPELTIYHDSTLPVAEKDKINAVRQDWYNMTAQVGYPLDFVRPQLNES
jgi:hypothetical protein